MMYGHLLDASKRFFFTIDPQPDIFPDGEARVCFHTGSVKLMTLSNKPTHVIYALRGGAIQREAKCVERENIGEFDVIFNEKLNAYAIYLMVCFYLDAYFF
jgi:hypothetical protein